MKKVTALFSIIYFMIVCFILLNIKQLSAQSAKVYELFEDDFQNSTKKVTKTSSYGKSTVGNKEGFFILKKNLKPTIYVEDNNIKKVTGNTAPLILNYKNSYSLDILKKNNSLIKDVELLTIKLKSENELNNRFDFSSVRGLNSLKYIYIQCNFKCTISQINSFILNVDPNVTVFYMVNNPS